MGTALPFRPPSVVSLLSAYGLPPEGKQIENVQKKGAGKRGRDEWRWREVRGGKGAEGRGPIASPSRTICKY